MKIYGVQEAGRLVTAAMQKDYVFKQMTLRGTISGLHTHFSGVTFFSLVEGKYRISCMIGRMHHAFLTRKLESGLEASITGDLKYDSRSGRPVLYVQRVMAVREGTVKQDRDALWQDLAAKGFFDPLQKKSLPAFPFHIGVITSGSGAVIHDILKTGKRRNDAVRYSLYNSAVQGEEAAQQLAAMIEQASQGEDTPDVLILARGGGAEEDLSPFNERILLEAIHHCSIPLVSAVGHETDTTLADLVADVRASTPTQAAEIVIPEKEWVMNQLQNLIQRMGTGIQGYFLKENENIKKEMLVLAYSDNGHAKEKQKIALLCNHMKNQVQKSISAGYKETGICMCALMEGWKDSYGRS